MSAASTAISTHADCEIHTHALATNTYSIRDAARIIGIPATTIRYYDKEGLLMVQRSDSGRRVFTDNDLAMMRVIECPKSTGLSLKEIRHYTELCKQGDASLQARYDMFAKQRDVINEQIEQLMRMRAIVDFKLDYYRTAIDAGTEQIHDDERPALSYPDYLERIEA